MTFLMPKKPTYFLHVYLNSMFKTKKCFGSKHNKEQITVMVYAGISDFEELNLLIIIKWQNSGCLLVTYCSINKAWIISEIYEKWLPTLVKKFCT